MLWEVYLIVTYIVGKCMLACQVHKGILSWRGYLVLFSRQVHVVMSSTQQGILYYLVDKYVMSSTQQDILYYLVDKCMLLCQVHNRISYTI